MALVAVSLRRLAFHMSCMTRLAGGIYEVTGAVEATYAVSGPSRVSNELCMALFTEPLLTS